MTVARDETVTSKAMLPDAGAVAIGRNEGERLRACLQSLVGRVKRIVYVDSGSTDGSQSMARDLGVDVVELDASLPFTAARARNAGFERLMDLEPELRFVQFVDGDCEVVDGWLPHGRAQLDEHPRLAIVCGRRREKHPEHSVYNRLCDIEWDEPIGDVKTCGGDMMVRASVLREVGGFNPDLIAGEELDLCFRIRRTGHAIRRLPADMTHHDAAMTRFSQWWKRSIRAGHAYAENAWMHGDGPERFKRRQDRSNLLWGLGLGTSATLGTVFQPAWLLTAAGSTYLATRIYRGQRALGRPKDDARAFALYCTVGKIPQALGAARFRWGRLQGRRSGLIEYK